MQSVLQSQKNRAKLMASKKKPYTTKLFNKKLVIFPKVFHPASDTKLLIKTIKSKQSDVILEPCSGTGAISIFLGQNAKSIIATDINPNAIKNIKKNVELHKLNKKIKVIKADVFPPTKIKFDFIIINPPYTDRSAGNVVERSMWDKGNHVMHKLFANGKRYLKKGGKIYTTWANFANFEFIEKLALKHGYKFRKIAELKKEGKTYRIYEIKWVGYNKNRGGLGVTIHDSSL